MRNEDIMKEAIDNKNFSGVTIDTAELENGVLAPFKLTVSVNPDFDRDCFVASLRSVINNDEIKNNKQMYGAFVDLFCEWFKLPKSEFYTTDAVEKVADSIQDSVNLLKESKAEIIDAEILSDSVIGDFDENTE